MRLRRRGARLAPSSYTGCCRANNTLVAAETRVESAAQLQQVSVLPRSAKELRSRGVLGVVVRAVISMVEYAVGEEPVNAFFKSLSDASEETDANSMSPTQLAEERIVWTSKAKDFERLRELDRMGRATANDKRSLHRLEVFSRKFELYAETGKGE